MTRHNDRRDKRATLLWRWIVNNLAVLFLIMIVMDLGFVYAIQTFYYAGARQKLTAELTSVVNILSRYAQDTETNLSPEMRATFESFSAKDKMELMALNVKGRVVLTSSGFSPNANASLPDYESICEGGDGYWVGKSDTGEKIMAVCADISSFSTEYSAVRVVTSLTEVDANVTTITIAATVQPFW